MKIKTLHFRLPNGLVTLENLKCLQTGVNVHKHTNTMCTAVASIPCYFLSYWKRKTCRACMVLPFFEMAKLSSLYSPPPIRKLSNQLRFCWSWLGNITHLVQLPWPEVFHLQVVPQTIVQERLLCLEKKKRHNSIEHAHYIIKRVGPHSRRCIFCASNAPNILGVLVEAMQYGVPRYSNRPPST